MSESERVWIYLVGEQRRGPTSARAIGLLVSSGDIDGDTLVWKPGMAEWQPAGAIAEIAALCAPPVPRNEGPSRQSGGSEDGVRPSGGAQVDPHGLGGSPSVPLRSGAVIDGRYLIVQGPAERVDLAGGMGCVYLCVDRQRNRPVALKTFRPEFTGHGVRDQLLREASTWIRLGNHPHIVAAEDLCRPQGGGIYLILELIAPAPGAEGASLRIQAKDHATLSKALLIGLGVARGMLHATGRVPGLVHRDIKPENILVGPDGVAKVSDFGLALTLSYRSGSVSTGDATLRESLTNHGIAGTPAYMAPEQWKARAIDQRADIYALGCVIKELVSGRPPVAGASLEAIAAAHAQGAGADMTNVPSSLHPLLRSMLAVDPRRRTPSWSDVVGAIGSAYGVAAGCRPPEAPATVSSGAQEANAFLAIGGAYLAIGNPQAAEEATSRAKALAEAAKDGWLTAAALLSQGAVLMARGAHGEAIPLLARAGNWYMSNNSLVDAARVLGNLGAAKRQTGDFEGALETSKAALQIFRAVGDRRGIAIELLHQANTLARLRKVQGAIEAHKESAVTADSLQDEAIVGMNLLRLALHMHAGPDASRATLRYAQLLYRRVGREDYAADVDRARKEFKLNGVYPDNPVEDELDALFSVPADAEALEQVVAEKIGLAALKFADQLSRATIDLVGFACVARAMREQGAILKRVITRSPTPGDVQGFRAAKSHIEGLSRRPSSQGLMWLDALRAQAVDGDVQGPRPGLFNQAERARYDLRVEMRGLGRGWAMYKYAAFAKRWTEAGYRES